MRRLCLPSLLLMLTACAAARADEPAAAPAVASTDDVMAEAPPRSAPPVSEVAEVALPPPSSGVSAAALLAAVTGCRQTISKGLFKPDETEDEEIPICAHDGAVVWTADMDIDCDGKESLACSKATDPWFQNQTSATDSKGKPLDAATVPFVVVPLPSERFDYRAAGIKLGTVVAVVYKDKVAYGIVGDEGPTKIIGEASYAMAKRLGINPDPRAGGVDGGVTYIAFIGPESVVGKLEDHAEAAALGAARAQQLVRRR